MFKDSGKPNISRIFKKEKEQKIPMVCFTEEVLAKFKEKFNRDLTCIFRSIFHELLDFFQKYGTIGNNSIDNSKIREI